MAIRVIKSRDYTKAELLEIASGLEDKAKDEQANCYRNSERDANAIELAFLRQVQPILKVMVDKEEEEKRKYDSAQEKLF